MALTCFLSGVLIDLDHVYDYIRAFGYPFKVKDFFSRISNHEVPRWTIIFHSWELCFLVAMIAWFSNWNLWLLGMLIGFGHHIILDKLSNGERLKTYSFIWRWKKDFIYKSTFPNENKANIT